VASTINRTFPLDLLRKWKLPYSCELVVSRETEDVGRRWMDVCTVVFKAPDDGYHYVLSFDVGKTEYQEVSWDEELSDPIDLARVEKRERTVVVEEWLPVEDAGESSDV